MVGCHYSKKQIKQMLKMNVVPLDGPSFVHKELNRRKREMDKRIKPLTQEMDEMMRADMASKWRPIKKPKMFGWVYRQLGVSKTPKIIIRIKDLFR